MTDENLNSTRAGRSIENLDDRRKGADPGAAGVATPSGVGHGTKTPRSENDPDGDKPSTEPEASR